MFHKYKAVLFDMDGTLIDSKPIIEKAWCTVAIEYGIELSSEDIELHIHGRSGSYTLNHLFGKFSLEERNVIKSRVDDIEERSDTDLLPGALEVLQTLKQSGIKVGLVTASWPSRIEYIFKLHQLHQYFEQVICRDDVEHGKPNPEGFILCARRLGVAPSDCLIFEDSISGILAANRSGAKCIGIGMSEIPEGESITVYAVYEDYTKMPAMFK